MPDRSRPPGPPANPVELQRRVFALETRVESLSGDVRGALDRAATAEMRAATAIGHLRAVVIAYFGGGLGSIHAAVDHARDFLVRTTGRDPVPHEPREPS